MSERLTWDLIVNDRSRPGVDTFAKGLDDAGQHANKNSKELDSFGSKAKEAFGKVEGVTSTIGKLAAKTALASTALVNGGQALYAAGGAVVAFSGFIGLVPGIVAAGATSLIALKLAVHGVGDAMTESDPKAYAADLKALSPSAREFVSAIHNANPELTAMRKSVQEGFFSQFSGDIKPLVDDYLPRFSNTLTDISTSFGDAVGGVTGFLKSADGINNVDALLGNVDDAALGVASAISPIAVGLIKVASVSSSFLPRLTSGLGEAGVKAGEFLDKITKGGSSSSFAQWVDRAFDEVGKLKRGIGELAAYADKPGLKSGFVDIFHAMQSAAKDVDKELPTVVDAVIKLEPAVANFVSGSGKEFGTSLKVYGSLAVALAPAITGISKGLAPIAPLLGVVVPLFWAGSKAIAAWSVISEVVKAVKEWTEAQTLLDVALDANVIGAIIIAIAAFVAIIIVAWKHSQTFRTIVIDSFKLVSNAVLGAIGAIIGVFGDLFGVLSHLPGKAGSAFGKLHDAAEAAKGKIDAVRASINAIPSHTTKTIYFDVVGSAAVTSARQAAGRGVPMNATGGRVMKNQATVVGDGGRPELFVPDQNGTIIPSVPSSGTPYSPGGAGMVVNVYVQGSPLASAREIREAVVTAFTKTASGSAKLPKTAVAG